MHYIFDAWCEDPRPLLFGEFLAEVNGFLVLPEQILDELDRQWDEPTEPFEQAWAALSRECRRRSSLGQCFAVCFAGTNHLDEYNNQYGRESGERVLSLISQILRDVVKGMCSSDGFVAHVGRDDFIFVIPFDAIPAVCGEVLEVFDTLIPYQYSEQDRCAGYFLGKDRRGQLHRVPLMTLSLGIVTNEQRRFQHFSQIAALATEMLSCAKAQPGSVFVVDRRHEPAGG